MMKKYTIIHESMYSEYLEDINKKTGIELYSEYLEKLRAM